MSHIEVTKSTKYYTNTLTLDSWKNIAVRTLAARRQRTSKHLVIGLVAPHNAINMAARKRDLAEARNTIPNIEKRLLVAINE